MRDDADRQRGEGGVIRGVVERERAFVRERVEDRRVLAVDFEDAEAKPPSGGERVGDVAEEALDGFGHELGLLAARTPVELHEPVERRGPLGLVGHAERDPPARFEAADLPPKLVRKRAQILDQGDAVVARKWSQPSPVNVAPRRPLLEQLRPGKPEQEDRRLGRS